MTDPHRHLLPRPPPIADLRVPSDLTAEMVEQWFRLQAFYEAALVRRMIDRDYPHDR